MRPHQPVTMRDVARQARVSPATVSRVLNDNKAVADDLSLRVHEAVSALNYVPNSIGRALRSQINNVWSIIISDIQNPFFTRVVAAVESRAKSFGTFVSLSNTAENLDLEKKHISAAITGHVSGVLLTVSSEKDSDLTPLLDARIPVVLLDRRTSSYNLDSVLVDNFILGRLAGSHLASRGYKKIACVTGPDHISSISDRLEGFRSALNDAKITFPQDLLCQAKMDPIESELAVRRLLQAHPDLDAIYATNGLMTAGTFRALQNMNIDMPSQMGLVGTDDEFWNSMVRPAVTVVTQPAREIGFYAADLLNERLKNPSSPPRHVTLPPELIIRESSQGPSAQA